MASLRALFHFTYSTLPLILIFSSPTTVNSRRWIEKRHGPPTNITKVLSFKDFNPTLSQEIKLLGSARFSDEINSVQIPDPTHTTINLQHQAGRALYGSPVRLYDPYTRSPASFQTTFSFQFTTTAAAGVPDSGGGGLTFIIASDEVTVGRPGPWLAMLNDGCQLHNKMVAVEFDTCQNAEFGDPNDNHVGINLGSIMSSKIANASDVGVSLKDKSIHRAWITYDANRKWLAVRLGSDSQDYPEKPLLTMKVDLSRYLKEYMFVGFSASAAHQTQIHNVLSWNFSSTSRAYLQLPSVRRTCENRFSIETHRDSPDSLIIFIAVMILCLAVFVNLYYSRKQHRPTGPILLLQKNQRPRPPHKPRRFRTSEIIFATRCFHEGRVLNIDSRGVRYKGVLPSGCHVEIMRFLNSSTVDRRRLKQIVEKVDVISQVHNKNLVGMRGWCCEDKKETIVVYDYSPNGSLDRWLFGIGALPWNRRFKVVKDVAESLSFLHSKGIAHRNVKASSVFLDGSFQAILGDFGFDRVQPSHIESQEIESVNGEKIDVFGFGIIAMEIVAGRKNVTLDLEIKQEIGAWSMHERENLLKVVDRRIGSVFNSEQVIRILEIGLLCTVSDSRRRPSMEEVVKYLETDSQAV